MLAVLYGHVLVCFSTVTLLCFDATFTHLFTVNKITAMKLASTIKVDNFKGIQDMEIKPSEYFKKDIIIYLIGDCELRL